MAVRHAFTVDEWHRMGETGLFGEDARMELLDGEVIEMSPIGSPHGGCVKYLTRALIAAVGDGAVIGVQDPVVLDSRSEPQPDLAVLTPRADGYRQSHPTPAEILLVMLRPGWDARVGRTGRRSLDRMLPQLPEPARHPTRVPNRRLRLIRAAVSPSAVGVTAAGAGVGVLADPHSAILAIVLGGGAWLGRMAVAVFRSRRNRPGLPVITIDPFAVPEPWRQYVRQAVGARQRFDAALAQWAPGPLKDRLLMLQPRLWDGVQEVWLVAQRGAALGGTGAGGVTADTVRPSIVQLSAELRRVQAERQGTPASDRQAVLLRSEEAIAAQLRAAHRSEEARAEVLDRLRVLTARLDEAVTQLLELGLEQAGGMEGSADAVAGSVDALVEEIAALHQGLREAGAASSSPESSAREARSPEGTPALPPGVPPSPPVTS